MDFRTGDIIATHDRGFLPRHIRYFMRIYAKKKGYKLDRYYNHTMIVLDQFPNYVGVGESIKEGFVTRGRKINSSSVIFRLKMPLTSSEKNRIKAKAVELIGTPYEFFNFVWWALLLLTGIDISPRGKKKVEKMFCFESTITCLNAGREIFKDPSKVTTVDIELDDRFEKIKL